MASNIDEQVYLVLNPTENTSVVDDDDDDDKSNNPNMNPQLLSPTSERMQSESESIAIEMLTVQLDSSNLSQINFHQLARDGDHVELGRILRDASPSQVRRHMNRFDDDHLTPLHYAARYNHLATVRLLIANGAHVDAKGEEGITPLHFAARYRRAFEGVGNGRTISSAKSPLATVAEENNDSTIGAANDIDVMLPNDVDPNSPEMTSPQLTERNRSEHQNTVEIIDCLVKNGADINSQDLYGLTPLHYAAMRGNFVVAQHLCTSDGIYFEAIDYQKMTPLHTACAHGRIDVVQLLLRCHCSVRSKDDQLNTPLHYATQDGHLDIAVMLLAHAERQNIIDTLLADRDYEENTSLHLAVDSGHEHIVYLLIEKGSDVNAVRKLKETPLHAACVIGHEAIAQRLLEHGAKLNARTTLYRTPLHTAAAYDHQALVSFLLDKSAHLECKDGEGMTPLLIAAVEGCLEAFKFLWENGANTEVADRLDRSTLFHAALYNNVEIAEFITSNPTGRNLIDLVDRYGNTPLHVACQNGFLDVVKTLIKQGAHIDSKNEDDSTPMHLAAEAGMTRIVREMISTRKEVVYDEDEDSNTALHLASLNGHEQVLSELLEGGADIAARNAYLWTPLDCAAAKGWVNCVRILLEEGAPTDPMDRTKTTPLQLAAKNGWSNTVSVLLGYGAKVDMADFQNHTALTLAVINGHVKAAMAIVNDPSWKIALLHSRQRQDSDVFETPIRLLIRKMPLVARRVFDRCMETEGRSDAYHYKIKMDYSFLEDTYLLSGFTDPAPITKISELLKPDGTLVSEARPYSSNRLLLLFYRVAKKKTPSHGICMSECMSGLHSFLNGLRRFRNVLIFAITFSVHAERDELLSHPLSIGLLRHKWSSFGRYVYYSTLGLYGIFLFFLTSYLIATPATLRFQNETIAAEASNGDVCCEVRSTQPDVTQKYMAFVSKFALMIVLVPINLLRELFQLINRGVRYISFENILEWTVYVSAFLFVFDFSDCCQETGVRLGWQWQLGACCIFLAWLNLVLFIRKFPQFGIYVVMFTDIFWTFSRFFVVFALFLAAFAFGFYALLQNHYPFRRFDTSLLKTMVMMIGELEFDSTFNDKDGTKINYKIPTYLLFVTFLIIMTILIMNLLVGLAVDDIQGVQEKAKLKKLAMQVKLVMEVENSLPNWLRRRTIVLRETIMPNKGRLRRFKAAIFELPSALSSRSIAQEINRDLQDMERLQETQSAMQNEVSRLQKQVKQLNVQNDKLGGMIHALIDHFDIDYKDGDQLGPDTTGSVLRPVGVGAVRFGRASTTDSTGGDYSEQL